MSSIESRKIGVLVLDFVCVHGRAKNVRQSFGSG